MVALRVKQSRIQPRKAIVRPWHPQRINPLPIIPQIPGPATPPPDPPAITNRVAASRSSIFLAVGLFLLLTVAYKLLKELEIIYVSALFAVVLMPIVNKITDLNIRGYRPSRAVAIIFMVVVTALLLTIFFIVGLPPVLRDLRGFLTDLPARIPSALARVKRLPMADKFGVDELAAKAENLAGAVGAYLFASVPRWLSHIFDILTAIFLCIYFMLEGENAYNFFLSIFPFASRRRLDLTMRKAELKMSKWLFGQGLLMLILGVCSLVVFGFLHVRYFILLGVLMGLLNIIPIAGGIVTIVVVGIVAALDSWAKMAGVFIFYAIYVNVENAVLTPRIMRSSVDLMGLTVLVALLLGTALAGIVGALVAVPTAALISVLLEEYAVQH